MVMNPALDDQSSKMSNNLYSILESSQSASHAELKRNYQRLAKEHHPDKTSGSIQGRNTGEKFIEIDRAWKILQEDRSRRQYDATLSQENFAFGSSTKRFQNVGIHPQLITEIRNPLGPGHYDLSWQDCKYKTKSSSWKRKQETEEFSKYLGFRNCKILEERNFRKTVGGPGTYEITEWAPKTGPSVLKNLGLGVGTRFKTFIKDDAPPPGTYNLKRPKTKFNSLPTFEWDGFVCRFKNPEPPFRKAPNRYDLKPVAKKRISKRGPYDCFTGPRDGTTIKNHFTPAKCQSPDLYYDVEGELDHLLNSQDTRRCGLFLRAERFPANTCVKVTENGFSFDYRDPNYPGPGYYDFSPRSEGIKVTSKPFNSSNVHARPPPDWRIHPGPERYRPEAPKCRNPHPNPSWMFLSKGDRTFYRIESFTDL